MMLEVHPHRRDRFLTVLESIMAAPLRTDVRHALTELRRRGLSLDQVEARMDFQDPAALAPLYFALERLDACGVLCRTVVDRLGEPLVSVEPLAAEGRNAPSSLEGDVVIMLSPYAFAHRDLDEIVVEVPTGAARLRFRDAACLALVGELASPIRFSALQRRLAKRIRPTARELVEALMTCGIVETSELAPSKQFRRECWEFHDLLFHARSREGWVDATYGGSYRFRGYSDPPAALKERPPGDQVALPPPGEPPVRGFWEVLETRRSQRQAPHRLRLEHVSALLWHAARIRSVEAAASGQATTRRVYPSGGACHALEIYLVARDCAGLEPAVYYYESSTHTLVRITDDVMQVTADAGRAAGLNSPAEAVLIITARFRRVAWKYEGIAYALVLKEVGAFMQTLALTATALGIGACPLGNGDGVNFCAAAGLDYAVESPVGELLLVGAGGDATA